MVSDELVMAYTFAALSIVGALGGVAMVQRMVSVGDGIGWLAVYVVVSFVGGATGLVVVLAIAIGALIIGSAITDVLIGGL